MAYESGRFLHRHTVQLNATRPVTPLLSTFLDMFVGRQLRTETEALGCYFISKTSKLFDVS